MMRFRVTLVLVLVLTAAVSVTEARLPQWALDIAATAPPVPEGVPQDDFRTVLKETSITVGDDGRLKTVIHIARQVLVSTAWAVGVGDFGSDSTSTIKKLNAWHLPPPESGKRRSAEKSKKNEELVISQDGYFTSDNLSHLVGGWEVYPGSLVFFEVVVDQSPHTLAMADVFHLDGPLVQGRVTLELPPGWSVQSDWLHYDGPDAVVAGTAHTWEIRDLPAVETAELGESVLAASPMLVLSVVAPAGTRTVGASLPSWDKLAIWYEALAGKMSVPDDSIRSAATGLAGGPDYVADLISMAAEVRDKVRYVAKEVGVEGYRPRPAAETWSNLYGDCKDKATLLQAMLQAREIRSYPVLVNATSRDMVSEKVPGPIMFNHVILAVPLPPESEHGTTNLPAVLPESPLGPLMIIDTTDDSTTPGWLPAHLAGKKVLVLDEAAGHILELPAWNPESHRLEREVRLRQLENGAWRFTRVDRRYGEYASSRRVQFRRSAADHEKDVFRWVKEHWTGAEPGGFEVHEEEADGAFVEKVEWTVPQLAGRFETLELPPFPEANSLLSTVSVTRRTAPVVYDFPRTISLTVVLEDLPPEVGIPEPGRRDGDGWYVQTTWSRKVGEVQGTMRFVMDKTRFTPEEYRDLRRMYSALKNKSADMIRVPRGS